MSAAGTRLGLRTAEGGTELRSNCVVGRTGPQCFRSTFQGRAYQFTPRFQGSAHQNCSKLILKDQNVVFKAY